MASELTVVLALALVACAFTAPATTPADKSETTTEQGDEVLLVEELEIKEIPVVVAVIESTTLSESETKGTTSQPEHKLAKRSALRGDNPSHDLLANRDGLQFDDGLVGLDGRRIKFLPTWVG